MHDGDMTTTKEQAMNTITSLTARTVEWTDEYGDTHKAYVEMVLAHDDEYPADVVAAVVAAEGVK